MKRSLLAHFLNTGTIVSPVLTRMGKGISEMDISYNAEEESNKYIDEDGATNEVIGYSPSSDVKQKCKVGETIFEYIDEMRKSLAIEEDAKTEIVDANLYDELATGVYSAEKYGCTIVLSKFNAQEIEYAVKRNGNATQGYITVVTSQGATTTTFTAGTYTPAP